MTMIVIMMVMIRTNLDYPHSWGLGLNGPDERVPLIENMNINKSCQILFFFFLALFLRISEICCLLTPYSVDKLVPFSNRKIIADSLSFMGRTNRLLFVHTDKLVPQPTRAQ